MAKVRKINTRPQFTSPVLRATTNTGFRVAAYARVSTDAEEQSSSFEAQKDYYERLINETPGWTFAGIYADRGITGTSTEHELIEVKGDNKIDNSVVRAKQAAAEEMAVASGIRYIMYPGSVVMNSHILDDDSPYRQESFI